MAKLAVLAFFLLLVAFSAANREESARRHQRHRSRDREQFQDLEPRNPKEIFRSEGGRIEEWHPEDYPALCDAEVGAKKLTLQRNGLTVPNYKDAEVLKIVTRGRFRAGIINPLSDKVIDRNIVFDVRKGDVIALPRGVASWFYNDGNEEAEILEIADTSNSPQCGRSNAFLLAGGRQENYGSVLQGFSSEMVAHAWDVDEQTIKHVFEGRKGAGIIKVDERKMQLPESSRNSLFMDFVYRFKDGEPDVNVRNAGEVRLLTSSKFPVLRALNMGACSVKMQEGALTAPGYIHNAHKVMYVEQGKGRVQVVRENGERAVDTQLEQGQLLIIPANFPSVKLAGNEGFRYVAALTNDRPVESYLAGRNSVYQGIPRKVVSAAFQIDDRLLQRLAETRQEEAYLFPPRRQPKRGGRDSFIHTLVGVV